MPAAGLLTAQMSTQSWVGTSWMAEGVFAGSASLASILSSNFFSDFEEGVKRKQNFVWLCCRSRELCHPGGPPQYVRECSGGRQRSPTSGAQDLPEGSPRKIPCSHSYEPVETVFSSAHTGVGENSGHHDKRQQIKTFICNSQLNLYDAEI